MTPTPEAIEAALDGNRPLPFDRDTAGRLVREAWIRWAETQPNPKPSWLVPYDELAEADKEADRQIGEAIARWTLIHDAAALAAADAAMEAAGWVRVPVEPTQAMLANTVDEKGTIRVLDFTTPEERGKAFLMPRYVYRAMIAARPTEEEKEG